MQRYVDYDHNQRNRCQHGYKVYMEHIRLEWFMQKQLITSG